MRTAITLLVILLILTAFLMRDTDRHYESYSIYVEDACEEQETDEEEDVYLETGEEEEREQEEDVEGPGEDAVHEGHGSGGGQSPGGGGGQAPSGGGQTQEETPRYPFFMENGFYICKGITRKCYVLFCNYSYGHKIFCFKRTRNNFRTI